MGRLKYLCARRYDPPLGVNAKCGGRVRMQMDICTSCRNEIELEQEMARMERRWLAAGRG